MTKPVRYRFATGARSVYRPRLSHRVAWDCASTRVLVPNIWSCGIYVRDICLSSLLRPREVQ